jgi:hypothetical protein
MNDITFIHIGKTGGSYLIDLLGIDTNDKIKYRHICNKPERDPKRKYIIWIRNPISRFVSAFNYVHAALKHDASSINEYNLKTCIMPDIMQKRFIKKTNYLFSKEYDENIMFFETPNKLAEALSSSDGSLKKRALNVMNSEIQHIHKGLGWYLYNGGFVKNLKDNILFVGKMETMDEDANTLFTILKKKYEKRPKLRENIYVGDEDKFMSDLAIANIINYYKNSDYAVLKEMKEVGFISGETYKQYHTYNNPVIPTTTSKPSSQNSLSTTSLPNIALVPSSTSPLP